MTQTAATDTGTMPAAEPLPVAALVDYGAGAIVSRTLSKGKAGTLTVFAFDAGQELSEHSAPFDAFVQVLDGTATLTIGGKPVRTPTGSLVLMPANVPHGVKAETRMKMLLVMLKQPA